MGGGKWSVVQPIRTGWPNTLSIARARPEAVLFCLRYSASARGAGCLKIAPRRAICGLVKIVDLFSSQTPFFGGETGEARSVLLSLPLGGINIIDSSMQADGEPNKKYHEQTQTVNRSVDL